MAKNKQRKNIKQMSILELQSEKGRSSGSRKLSIINELTKRSK